MEVVTVVHEFLGVLEQDILRMSDYHHEMSELKNTNGWANFEMAYVHSCFKILIVNATTFQDMVKGQSVLGSVAKRYRDFLDRLYQELEREFSKNVLDCLELIKLLWSVFAFLLNEMKRFWLELKGFLPLDPLERQRVEEICRGVYESSLEVHPSTMEDISLMEGIPLRHVMACFARIRAKEARELRGCQ